MDLRIGSGAWVRSAYRAVVIAVAGVAGLVVSAEAATIQSVFPTINSDNTVPYSDNTDPRNEYDRDLALTCAAGPLGFCTRYASIMTLDVKPFGTVDTDVATSSYNITFNVVAAPTEQWMLSISTRRNGALTIHNDNGTYAQAEIYSVEATAKIGVEPLVHLAASEFGQVLESNEGSSGSNRNTVFNQGPGVNRLCGTGSQTVVLNFRWQSIVVSHGGVSGGDEAAVRLGRAAVLSGISAGDYPGPDGDPAANDGHFVDVSISAPGVTTNSATVCSDLGTNICTFTANGATTGCLGQNYRVFLAYTDAAGNLIATDVVTVTNGAQTWTSVVSVPCSPLPPYRVSATLVDDPGIVESKFNFRAMALAEEGFPLAPCSVGPVHVPGLSGAFPAAAALVMLSLVWYSARRRSIDA